MEQVRNTAVRLVEMRKLAHQLETAYTVELVWPLFECLDELVCIANEKGFFIKLNEAWPRLLGWTKEKLIATPWLELVHPDDRQKTIQAAATMKEKPLLGFTNRYLCSDGGYREIEWFCLKWNSSGFTFCVAKEKH